MMTRFAIAIAGFGLFAAATFGSLSVAEAGCSWPAYRFQFSGAPTEVPVVATPGAKCVYEYHAGGRSTFESAEIVEPPRHGTAFQSNKASATYVASRDFRGPDKFVVQICGVDISGRGCGHIIYNVTIK
jgi:hypothetical protein